MIPPAARIAMRFRELWEAEHGRALDERELQPTMARERALYAQAKAVAREEHHAAVRERRP